LNVHYTLESIFAELIDPNV